MGSLRFLNDLKTISKSVDKAHQTIVAFKTVQHRARWLPRKLASYKNLYHPNHDPAIYPRFVHWTIREYNLYTIKAYSHTILTIFQSHWPAIGLTSCGNYGNRLQDGLADKINVLHLSDNLVIRCWIGGWESWHLSFSFSRLGLNCSWDSHVH